MKSASYAEVALALLRGLAMFSFGTVSFGLISIEVRIPITIGKRTFLQQADASVVPQREARPTPATLNITHMQVAGGPPIPIPPSVARTIQSEFAKRAQPPSIAMCSSRPLTAFERTIGRLLKIYAAGLLLAALIISAIFLPGKVSIGQPSPPTANNLGYYRTSSDNLGYYYTSTTPSSRLGPAD